MNLDKQDYGQVSQADMLTTLPFATDTFDYVVANCSLSSLTYHELPVALAEIHRIMKPGAVLRVLVADVLEGFRRAERGDAEWFPVSDEISPWAMVKFSIWVTWYGDNLTAFTPLYLEHVLRGAGFHEVTRVDHGATTCDDPGICELDDRVGEVFIMEGRCVSA